MRFARLDAGETTRRRIGRGVVSTVLSSAGLVMLWTPWGWDSLVRTHAGYFTVLGLGFGALTWVFTQRLQQWAEPGESVVSEPTWEAIDPKPDADTLEPAMVKGRDTAVGAYRFPQRQP